MLKFPKKFVGSCIFDYEPISIQRAIYRNERNIVIEFTSDGWLYTVDLKSNDGRVFEGRYTARRRSEIEYGKVKAKVHWDETGPLLFGSWHEHGSATWLARLTEVDKFEDEEN